MAIQSLDSTKIKSHNEIRSETENRVEDAKSQADSRIRSIAEEYETLGTSNSGLQATLEHRAEPIAYKIMGISGSPSESDMADLREFGLVSKGLVSYLQSLSGNREQLNKAIRLIIDPDLLYTHQCVFGSQSLNHGRESKAHSLQSSMLGTLVNSDKIVPDYLSFTHEVGLSNKVAKQERRYANRANQRSVQLAESVVETRENLTEEKSRAYQDQQEQERKAYTDSVHAGTLARSQSSPGSVRPKQVSLAKESLGLDSQRASEQSLHTGYIPSESEYNDFLTTVNNGTDVYIEGLPQHLAKHYSHNFQKYSGEGLAGNDDLGSMARAGLSILVHELKQQGKHSQAEKFIKDARSQGIISSNENVPEITPRNISTTSENTSVAKIQNTTQKWESYLQDMFRRENVDPQNATEEDLARAASKLLNKDYKSSDLQLIRDQAGDNSQLAQVIDQAIYMRRNQQLENFLEKGGDTRLAADFFINNESTMKDFDRLLEIANKKNDSKMLELLAQVSKSTGKDYSNIA